MLLKLPLVIQGYTEEGGSWEEDAVTGDTSAGGVSFTVPRALVKGQVLHLALPLPPSLRQFDHDGRSYYVYALVRDVTGEETRHRVGAMFFGRDAPRGFGDKPWARFLLPDEASAELSAGSK